MSKRKSGTPRARLAEAMRDFLSTRVWLRGPNAGKPCDDQEQAIGVASEDLGDRWSETSIRTALGTKSARTSKWFPQGTPLMRFCEVSGVSADWLFFGVGPKMRRAAEAGGRLTQEQLAGEIASYVTGLLAESEYLARFGARVSGDACLERLAAIAAAENDAQSDLVVVLDAVVEAFDNIAPLRSAFDEDFHRNYYRPGMRDPADIDYPGPAFAPLLTAIAAMVSERASFARAPKTVDGPQLLQIGSREADPSLSAAEQKLLAALPGLERSPLTLLGGRMFDQLLSRSPKAKRLYRKGLARSQTRT